MKNQEKIYEIVWNGEVVDTADNKKEAYYLKNEYEIAWRSEVNVRIINK